MGFIADGGCFNASRIAVDGAGQGARTWKAASDTSVIDWVPSDRLIFSTAWDGDDMNNITFDAELQWRNTNGGSWTVLAATGEIKWASDTDLVNGNAVVSGEEQGDNNCSGMLDGREDGEEIEGAASTSFISTKKLYHDLQWALDLSGATAEDTYEFRVVETGTSTVDSDDPCLADVTIEAPSGPTISAVGDGDFTFNETNIVATGTSFGATETGLAKVELCDNSVYASATKVSQSVDTWSDTSIQFDLVPTGLFQNNLWIFITDAAGNVSDGYAVTVHLIPVITNAGDEVFTVYETNIVLTGTDFFALQGAGKVELGDNAVYASANKVTQSIDTWGDSSIQFDLTIGSLDVESLWLYVTNYVTRVSNAYPVTVGLTPTVTAVGDDTLGTTETNIVLTGATFLNAIGTGKLEFSDNATYATGTKVTQSIDTWANGSIQFDVVIGSLTASTLYAWITNDLGFRNAVGYSFTMVYPVAPAITSVDGDDSVQNTQEGVLVVGTDFEATQGVGKVELCPSATYGSAVLQTINSWGNLLIDIDIVQGGLSLGSVYMFITNNSSERNASGYEIIMTPGPINDGFWIQSSIQEEVTSAGLNKTVFLQRDDE